MSPCAGPADDVFDVVQITATVTMLRFEVVNAYVVRVPSGVALIDTGPIGSGDAILDALAFLEGPTGLAQIVLTHSHKDHAGSARELVEATGAEVLAGAHDAPVLAGVIEEPAPEITAQEQPFYDKISPTIPPAPSVRVDRVLRRGDDLGWHRNEVVIEVPGHTPGSIAVHLVDEELLFTGDNVASIRGRAILGPFNVDRLQAIASYRRLASMDIDIACFGHGDPLVGSAGAELLESSSRF